MKYKLSLAAATLCLCVLLSGCQHPDPADTSSVNDTSTSSDAAPSTPESKPTDDSSSAVSEPVSPTNESRPIIPVEFENDYYSIETVISNQVDQDEYKRFIEMYDGTADFNIVNFVKHFNYPKELFASIVEENNLDWLDADVIYSGDEDRIAKFFRLGDYMSNTKYADYVETDLSKYKPTGKLESVLESGLGTYCGHTQDFHSIPSYVYSLVDEEKHNSYIDERGWGVDTFDIVDYVKSMDISKEDYIASVNKCYPPDSEDADALKEREKILADAEIIYCEDDARIYNYFNQNDWSYKPAENEKEPSKNFFVTHGAIMRYLGVEGYHAYLDCVYGTKYDNIKNLIEYFKLDRNRFEEIMKKADALDFYDIDDLFSVP